MERARPNPGSPVARNSDLVGVASLLLILASPGIFAVGWTVVRNVVPEVVGAVFCVGSLALAIMVVATGRRGRGAAITAIAASVPIALVYLGTLVLRLMIE